MPATPEQPCEPARADFHNVSVNVAFAAAGLCGMTHLQTGRVCVKPARHTGSCDFRSPHEALAFLRASTRAVSGHVLS